MALAPPCAEQNVPKIHPHPPTPPQDKEPIGATILWTLRGPQRGLGDTGREGLLANVALGKKKKKGSGGAATPGPPPSDFGSRNKVEIKRVRCL